MAIFIKTKQSSGRRHFFLCIPEGGGNADTGKVIEHSVRLGETLNLSAERWMEILSASRNFRRVPLKEILNVVETYVAKHGLPSETAAGLREAVRGAPGHKTDSRVGFRKQPETDEYTAALKLLGLPLGSSDRAIESAFRKFARRHHPDVGGDPEKFRAVLAARNFLLGRETAVDYTVAPRGYRS